MRRPPSVLLGLLLLGLGTAPHPARADGDAPAPKATPRVLVVITAAEHGDTALAAEVQHRLTAALPADPGVRPFDPSPVLLGPAAATLAGHLDDGRQALAEGRKAYDNLDLDHAGDDFEDAAKAFTACLPALASPAPLVRALVFLGATKFLAGDQDAAHAAFVRALLLDPDHKPDPTIFSPPLAKAFNGARVEVAARPQAPLTVVSAPAGANVFIDGHWRGVTPLTLEKVTVGTHVLVISRRGRIPVVLTTDIAAGVGPPVKVHLDAGPVAGAYAREAAAATAAAGPQKFPKAAVALARRFPADRVVLGRVVAAKQGPPVLHLTAYAPAKGLRVATTSRVLADDDARRGRDLDDLARTWLPGVAAEPAPLPKPPPPVSFKLPPFARTWWFWAATGAGVAVIAGTAAALASSGAPDRRPGLILLGVP